MRLPQDSPWIFCGASITGPSHRRNGLPNQDAWRWQRWKDGGVLALADGMGSRKHADIGAQAACNATIAAVRRCRKGKNIPVEMLLRYLHLEWRLQIHPYSPDDCASTCLFAYIEKSRLLLAQLGDGLVAKRRGDGSIECLASKEFDFTNETLGLGVTRSLSDWNIKEMELKEDGIVLLATDGLSEEVVPEQVSAMMLWLSEELRGLSPRERWLKLSRELKNLDGPGRVDDRTLGLIFRNGAEEKV